MTTIATEECIHGLGEPMWCSLCRDRLGYRPGSDRQRNDCTIAAFAALTGASYGEAEIALRDAGRPAGLGATPGQLTLALEANGFRCREVPADVIPTRGTYLVAAYRAHGGHAYAVIDGTVHNAGDWFAARRRRVFEVS